MHSKDSAEDPGCCGSFAVRALVSRAGRPPEGGMKACEAPWRDEHGTEIAWWLRCDRSQPSVRQTNPDIRMPDRSIAYVMLRITLGINLLLHGLVRLPTLPSFAKGLSQAFDRTVLPGWLVFAFALLLPVMEATLGLLITVGKWTRRALFLGAGLMIVLVFGTALRQEWSTLGTQMVYALVYYVLLAGREHNRLCFDAVASPSDAASSHGAGQA